MCNSKNQRQSAHLYLPRRRTFVKYTQPTDLRSSLVTELTVAGELLRLQKHISSACMGVIVGTLSIFHALT